MTIASMTPMPRQFYAERVDQARNMARFYALKVSADLFGAMWLERRWGRIGSRSQIKVELVDDGGDSSKRIEAIVRQKTRRGYQPK